MPASVPKKCYEVIKSLLPFWRTRPEFGSHLMSQFLDDVGGYVEEYEKHGNLRSCVNKARGVLEILIVLLEVYIQDQNSVQQFYWDILQKTLSSCKSSIAQLGFEPSFRVGMFLSEYCVIFSTGVPLADIQHLNVVSLCSATVSDIMHKYRTNESAVVNCLKYFTMIFTVSSLPPEFTVSLTEKLKILEENSFFPFDVSGRPKLASALLSLLTSMMNPSVLPLLLASYTSVREKLLSEINSLREADEKQIEFLREREACLMILIGAFAKLASLKSSLIVMMGLRPSLFHLFLEEMPLTDNWFISKHPTVHFCLLRVMHSHVAA
ncbi:unnamed protein product [Strongylus vulgaris]|uniref:Uncharacterized protein n=1 Tax=Strongylus vulgaris TaxID=40348 RepID=A0A3P7I5N6_STRVU|nr:unnamed protein product [Strongylus vulgaris]